MGEVSCANDLKLGQPIALKFPPESIAADPDRLARFRNKVRLARQVSHPNVRRVYDIGEPGNGVFGLVKTVILAKLDHLTRSVGDHVGTHPWAGLTGSCVNCNFSLAADGGLTYDCRRVVPKYFLTIQAVACAIAK